MKRSSEFFEGKFIRRYKRFFADLETASGDLLTVHCPNTGSMRGCAVPGTSCWYSLSSNPKRKLPGTLEVVTTDTGDLAGINTGRANILVQEALSAGVVKELSGYPHLQREVKYGTENSRIDFLLSNHDQQCFVEVKNVTLGSAGGQGLFPDAVTARGAKHLRELMTMVEQGHRAVLLFCVQHSGIKWVSPADEIDPGYSELLRQAAAAGVEVIAYGAVISPLKLAQGKIALTRSVAVVL